MKHLTRPRAVVLVALFAIAALATVTAVAVASSRGPADLTYTPRSENAMPNIDVARAWAKNYYGAPTAASGPNGTWATPLDQTSNYAREASSVAWQGQQYLRDEARDRRSHGRKAIVLDVDDTTLTTWDYELYSNWDYNPSTNAAFVGLTGTTFTGNIFPATPGMVSMVNTAKALGYAIFFITGRGDSQHNATIANLVNDAAAGYPDLTTVTYSGQTVPEVDAGYPLPTPIDTGHGGFADGLFTKPSVGSYPSYLNQSQFCGSAIAASASCATIAYKSGTRAYIESQGYDIVADFGDQYSDLSGGHADHTYKLPNPMYFLP